MFYKLMAFMTRNQAKEINIEVHRKLYILNTGFFHLTLLYTFSPEFWGGTKKSYWNRKVGLVWKPGTIIHIDGGGGMRSYIENKDIIYYINDITTSMILGCSEKMGMQTIPLLFSSWWMLLKELSSWRGILGISLN